MSKIATIKKHPVQCVECQRCRQPYQSRTHSDHWIWRKCIPSPSWNEGKGSHAPAAALGRISSPASGGLVERATP